MNLLTVRIFNCCKQCFNEIIIYLFVHTSECFDRIEVEFLEFLPILNADRYYTAALSKYGTH